MVRASARPPTGGGGQSVTVMPGSPASARPTAETEQWGVTVDLLDDIRTLALAKGTPTLFVLIPAPFQIDPEACTGCKVCLRLGCPAIEWVPFDPGDAAAAGKKETQQGMARINPLLCDGCNQCPPLCAFTAIVEKPS